MDIYLIRHTTPLVEEGVCYGQTDLDLANSFDDEWGVLRKKLPHQFDAVYSSPLKRCKTLAKLLSTQNFTLSEKIIELNFGDWEMKKWDAIDRNSLQNWLDNFVDVKPPNGESFEDLHKRTAHFLQELLDNEHQSVAVVAHGGSIRTMISNILGLPLAESFKLELNYGKVSLIRTTKQQKKVCFINL